MAANVLKIGKVRPTYKGEWQADIPYEVLDWVQYRGLAYQAIQDVPVNREPDVTPAYWAQTGMKGDKGEKGDAGERGPAGVDGKNGQDGVQGPQGVGLKHKWTGSTLAFENPDGTWAAGADLQGPQGVQGPEGPVGKQGVAGPAGVQGPQGPQGLQGAQGVAGTTPPLNNTVTSTSTTEAATANAAKVAYDRGTAGVNAAATAKERAENAFYPAYGTATKSGTTLTLDLSTGLIFIHTFVGVTTIQFSNQPLNRNALVVLKLTNAGNYAVTWPPIVKWPMGVAPKLTANGVDEVNILLLHNGTATGMCLSDVR